MSKEQAQIESSEKNMSIAKTLYFVIQGTKRIMQECAPGEKAGAAIVFANMRFANWFNTLL